MQPGETCRVNIENISRDSAGLPVAEYLWGHPKGMYVLFLTEMWERFSFYGMRALLIFYLTQHFLYQDSDAFEIYGSHVSLVYVTPIIGGVIAKETQYFPASRSTPDNAT